MAEYPHVRLGQFITQRKEFFAIDDLAKYKRARVQSHGKGIVLRDEVLGSEIKTKSQQAARPGEFLVAEIDAKVGGFGIVPTELNGAVVSSHYFLFEVDEAVCLRDWLDWFIRSGLLEEQVKAQGSTNYAAIRPGHVLEYEIPLPPLPEQQRLVARIEAIARRVEEARGLRQKAVEEAKSLLLIKSGEVFSELILHTNQRPFGSFSPHVTSGPRYWGDKITDTGMRFYRAQDLGPNGKIINSSKIYIQPPDSNQGQSARLKTGDLMLVITGATVGRCAVYEEGLEPGFVNQHVAICRLPNSEISSQYALWFLRSPYGQSQLLGQRYGQGKPGLNLSNIRALTLPVPDLGEQHNIIAYLDGLQAKVDELKRLQAETQQELDALMPSVLAKAFAGELA